MKKKLWFLKPHPPYSVDFPICARKCHISIDIGDRTNTRLFFGRSTVSKHTFVRHAIFIQGTMITSFVSCPTSRAEWFPGTSEKKILSLLFLPNFGFVEAVYCPLFRFHADVRWLKWSPSPSPSLSLFKPFPKTSGFPIQTVKGKILLSYDDNGNENVNCKYVYRHAYAFRFL